MWFRAEWRSDDMRVLSLVVSMMLVAGTATAQQDPPPEATGDLAEVMRGILFPNSNILFDAQSTDPGADADSNANEGGASARFAGVYSGWEEVENAAIALAEAANLITLPGRTCENGEPVPIDQDNWKQWTLELRVAPVVEMLQRVLFLGAALLVAHASPATLPAFGFTIPRTEL